MELMHYINGSLIEEPIGFDNFKTKMQRCDYHGMSVEMSVGALEFYGDAAAIIRTAYDADLEAELTYEVYNGESLFYSGKIDLSTFAENSGQYCSVSCKVGEIGTKTTFNNRTEIDIDLNQTKDYSGSNLAIDYSAAERDVSVPRVSFEYVDIILEKKNLKTPDVLPDDEHIMFLNVPLSNVERNEFGTPSGSTMYTSGAKTINKLGLGYPHFSDGNDIVYDNGSATIGVDVGVDLKFGIQQPIFTNEYTQNGTPYLAVMLVLMSQNNTILARGNEVLIYNTTKAGPFEIYNLNLDDHITIGPSVQLHLGVLVRNTNHRGYYDSLVKDIKAYNNPTGFSVQPLDGSFIRLSAADSVDGGVEAKMMLIHDVLQKHVDIISDQQLSVVSSYYGRPDSIANPTTQYGADSLLAITNGYRIRGLFTDGDTERNFKMSFKTLIEALNANDCIGWAFDGSGKIRIERWPYFYNNNVVLDLSGADSIKREFDPDMAVSTFSIGYTKYEVNDVDNSIGTIHSTREFANEAKAISVEKKALSPFIADNYAVEVTRRAAINLESSEEFKYDENVFIFEMQKTVDEETGQALYDVAEGRVYVADNLPQKNAAYNLNLSPRRMAERWKDLLFTTRGAGAMKFKTGTINCQASTLLYLSDNDVRYNDTYADMLAENADIEATACIFRAEKISSEYPLTLAQYEAVKANPYGLIKIDGYTGWIKEFTYSLIDGMAEFTLIAKAN